MGKGHLSLVILKISDRLPMMALRKSKPKGNSFPQGLRIILFLNYGFRKLARSLISVELLIQGHA